MMFLYILANNRVWQINGDDVVMSGNKIVCKHQNLELSLDCSKLELNLFRILKLLNQVNLLPILFPERYPQQKIEQIEKTEKAEKIQKTQKSSHQKYQPPKQPQTKKNHEHQLTTTQAMNLIWFSAYMCKAGRLVPYQMQKLLKNKLVGQKSEIDEIIESIEAKITRLKNTKTDKNQSLLGQAKIKLARMQEIKKLVRDKWSYLKQKYQVEHPPSTEKTTRVGPYGMEIKSDHRQMLCKFVRRHLIKLDTAILQQSIMFIQEIQDGHCLVSVEQCYPSFMVYKELLKSLIGIQHYYRGLKQLLLCKQQSFKQGRAFQPENYVMCHVCKKIELLQQIKKRQTQKICCSRPIQPNVYSTSHAFDELYLKVNYHHLPLKSLPETEIRECYEQSKDFQSYVYPYYKVYYPQCSRYYCQICLFMLQSIKQQRKAKQAKKKSKQQKEQAVKLEQDADFKSQSGNQMCLQKQPCVVCLKSCPCDRCSMAQKFKKLMAIYNSLGGIYQELQPELMFINFYCTRVHLQLVTFSKEQEREEQNSEQNRVELQKTDQDTLSYPEQVVKLQGWFSKLRDKQRVKLYGEESVYNDRIDEYEDVDDHQIFPQLQQMYNKLLKEQDQNQSSVKMCKQETQSVISRSGNTNKSQYNDSDDQS